MSKMRSLMCTPLCIMELQSIIAKLIIRLKNGRGFMKVQSLYFNWKNNSMILSKKGMKGSSYPAILGSYTLRYLDLWTWLSNSLNKIISHLNSTRVTQITKVFKMMKHCQTNLMSPSLFHLIQLIRLGLISLSLPKLFKSTNNLDYRVLQSQISTFSTSYIS